MGVAVAKALGFVATAILARIFTPSDFGVLAIALLVTGLFAILSELGIAGVLITRQAERSELAPAAFGLGMVASLLSGFAISVSAAVLLATGMTSAGWVLLSTVPSVVLGGPVYFLFVYMQTRLQYFELFFVQVIMAVGQLASTLLFVLLGVGISAIPLGIAVGAAASVALQLLILRRSGIPVPSFDPGALLRVVRLGRAFLGQTILTYATDNSDKLVAGVFTGTRGVGLYTQALKVAELPYLGLVQPTTQVAFVRMGGASGQREVQYRSFINAYRVIGFVVAPISAVMIAAASTVLLVLFGPNWADASVALALLGARVLFRLFEVNLGNLLNATGYAATQTRIAAWTYVLALPLLVGGALVWGIGGIAGAMVALSLIRVIVQLVAVARRTGILVGETVLATVRNLTGCAISVVLIKCMSLLVLDADPLVFLALSAAVAVATQLLWALAADPPLRRTLAAILRRRP
jgi:PST family polysaccharide transporter